MKYSSLLIIAGIALFACSCVFQNRDTEENPYPNIVLIMADDLGYGDLSCYGSTRIHTPNLDKLASEGIKFLDFHSNGPVCSPTRAALLTGRYQQRTGVEGVVTAAGHREVGLSLDEITLAEELKKKGYTCGIFGKWHLGYAPRFNPSLQGFDNFIGYVSGNVDYHSHVDLEGYLDWWSDTIIDNEVGYTTDLITQYGIEFIKQNQDRPFFLYLPHEAPHSPFQGRVDNALRRVGERGTDKVPEESIPGIYKEMVEVMDEGIGKIIQTLKETGTDDRTIIIFCSDNGATRNGSCGVLRGNKGGVYEGGHRVPAIAWNPQNIEAGSICDQTVLSMDFYPTILDFAGVGQSDSKIDGISIKDLLLTGETLPERDLFWSYKGRNAIRSGHWKLVSTIHEDGDIAELFNLMEDLSEKNNLSGEYPELVQQLKGKLERWQKEVREGVEIISK